MAGQVQMGVPTPLVCSITGVAPSTLDYWILKGLVRPSIREGSGRRATRYWSVRDVVVVRSVKALRDAGCPLGVLRKIKPTLDELGEDGLSGNVLVWDGADVLVIDKWGNLESLRKRPRQQMLHIVAIPVADWERDAHSQIRVLPVVASTAAVLSGKRALDESLGA